MAIEPAIAASEPASPVPVAPARAAGITLNVEIVAWALVLATAACLRLVRLDAVLPATEEAVRARPTWEFAHGAVTGGWTGDLTSTLAALMLRVGDDGIAWARLAPALFGVAAAGLVALLRPYAGRAVALAGAMLLAISPVAVAAARTLNPDTAGLVAGLLMLWLALRIGEDGDAQALPLLGAVAGVAVTTGAAALAVALIVACWVALEAAWLDRVEVAERWRAAVGGRGRLGMAVALALPGLLLGLTRFGAGPDRLFLAAFADWSGPPRDAAALLPWHAPLAVLPAYEPLILVLGLAGLVMVAGRWRVVSPFERLLLVWTAGGLVITLAALHHRPGQMLVLVLPLALLAARATVTLAPGLALFDWRRSGVPLLLAAIVLGYTALQLIAWVQAGSIDRGEALVVIGFLILMGVLVAWALGRSPIPARGAAGVAAAWLLGGALVLHGAAGVAFRGGQELLWGQRPLPQREALVRRIEDTLAGGGQVAVERPVAAALAWDLRGRDVRLFIGLPPASGTTVAAAETATPAAPGGSVPGTAVEERWYPTGWDTLGVARWLVYREAWGPSRILAGELPQAEP